MLYKVLDEDGSAYYGGMGKWSLPHDGQPGGWMPRIERLEMCFCGYHLIDALHLVEWLGPTIYEAEGDAKGELVKDGKHCVHTARLLRKLVTWNERTARLFACDCAEQALPVYEQYRSSGKAPRHAIEIARRFADGKATKEELAAAWAAARAAAGDAAGDAAGVWQTQRLFEYLSGQRGLPI